MVDDPKRKAQDLGAQETSEPQSPTGRRGSFSARPIRFLHG